MGHNVYVNSVDKSVFDSRFQGLLHGLGQDQKAERVDRATDFMINLGILASKELNEHAHCLKALEVLMIVLESL